MMNPSNQENIGYPASPPPPEDMFPSVNSGVSVDDENPGFDQGHSLPNVDELKTDVKARGGSQVNEDGEAIGRRTGGWVVWLALFLALLVIAVVVGVAVAATKNDTTPSTTNSNTAAQTFVPASTPRPTSAGPAPVATPAPAPTGTASDTRMGEIASWLLDQGISTQADLNEENSPQQQALNYIAVNDEYIMNVPAGSKETPEGYDFMTRYVLATLYYSTFGSRWSFDLKFMQPISICSWYSVLQYVDMTTEYRGAACDQENNQIVALFLNQNNLEGTLPKEIGLLTSLKNLDIDLNKVRGKIPDTYQGLRNMENIFVSGNNLSGSIPSWISSLTKMKNINFSHNLMTGQLPTSLGSFPNLEGLALDNNLFTGNLNAPFNSDLVPGLRNLEQFYMENNQFVGTLGDNFMKDMKKIIYLDISDNMIGGSVPSHLFELPKLFVLDLHDNEFDSMPNQFQATSNLGLLALQKCNFANQQIPPSISNLRSLSHLDVSQNSFTGEIPSSIGDLKNITYLFLAQNDFVPGTIPSWLETLPILEELSLKDTQRTGTIPEFFGTANSNLILLDLDKNRLTGSIPNTLGNLEDLHILLLNRNNLTSTIPASFANLQSLKLIFLEANTNISGSLGTTFCDNPAFVVNPIIIAGCDLCDPLVDCCELCCAEGKECNDGIHVPDLDPIWQLGYQRIFFTFRREDYFMKEGETRHLVQVDALPGN